MPRTGTACSSFLRLLLGAVLLASQAAIASAAETKVVVTVKPVHALVSAIMDGVGAPQLIVEGSASPHTFTLKPSAAYAIETADVFIRVSEATEPFTERILDGLPDGVTVLTLADARHGVKLLDLRAGGAFEAHDEGDEGAGADHHHEGAAKDGHIWLDPDNAKAICGAVATVLATRYPGYAETFKANAAKLTARIDALSSELEAELSSVKGRPFVVFHDAYQYFEKRFGLKAAGSITVSPDQQPSAKRLSEIRAKIKSSHAACVFAEPGFKPNLVAAVSEDTGAATATLDPEGLLLEPGPELYFGLMKGLASGFKTCLGVSASSAGK